MRVLAFAPSCRPQPSLSTTTSSSTLATTLASAAPSSVARVRRAPGTGMPTTSRCAAPIPAACARHPAAVIPCPGGPGPRGGLRSPSRVPGDDVLAPEQGDHAAEREEGAEREVQLARAQAIAGQQQRASGSAGPTRPMTTAITTERPTNNPSTNASLTSPIPIPPGESNAAINRNPPAAKAASSSSGRSDGVSTRREREARDGQRQRDAVGNDAVAQIDRADADERERQHERRDHLAASRRIATLPPRRRAPTPARAAGREVAVRVQGGCSSSSSAPFARAIKRGSSGSHASAPSPPPTAASAPTVALIRPAPRGA